MIICSICDFFGSVSGSRPVFSYISFVVMLTEDRENDGDDCLVPGVQQGYNKKRKENDWAPQRKNNLFLFLDFLFRICFRQLIVFP